MLFFVTTCREQPVGFAPYSLQSLNTPESIGRVMIFHQPRVQPVREGMFQVRPGASVEGYEPSNAPLQCSRRSCSAFPPGRAPSNLTS